MLAMVLIVSLVAMVAGCEGGGVLGPGLHFTLDKSVNISPGVMPEGALADGAGANRTVTLPSGESSQGSPGEATNLGNRGWINVHYQTDSAQDIESTMETVSELRELLDLSVTP